MQVIIPFIIFVLVIIFVIVLFYDKNLQIDYKNHVLKSKRLGKYVIIPFDSFLNMDRADKHYFCYENYQACLFVKENCNLLNFDKNSVFCNLE